MTGLSRQLLLLACVVAVAPLRARESTLEDLLSVQRQVQSVLDQARKAVVALESGGGTASGVIVSPQGLVLTAAHVTNIPGKKFKVTLQSGKTVEAESLGLDTATDAAMLQLPAPAKAWPFTTINREMRALKLGDWCFALGHPGGWDAARGSVLRVGKLVKISPNMLQSDCVLMGGDSGGALFNLAGEVIGINSQIWRGRDQNLHVSMAPFLRSWEAMKKREVVSEWNQGSGAWIGLSTLGVGWRSRGAGGRAGLARDEGGSQGRRHNHQLEQPAAGRAGRVFRGHQGAHRGRDRDAEVAHHEGRAHGGGETGEASEGVRGYE